MNLCGLCVLLGALSIFVSISTCLCNLFLFSWFLSKYFGKADGEVDYAVQNYQERYYSGKRHDELIQTLFCLAWDLLKIMKELTKILYPLLVIFGIYTLLYAFLAVWSTKGNACMIPFLFKSSRAFYSNCGSRIYDSPPPI